MFGLLKRCTSLAAVAMVGAEPLPLCQDSGEWADCWNCFRIERVELRLEPFVGWHCQWCDAWIRLPMTRGGIIFCDCSATEISPKEWT